MTISPSRRLGSPGDRGRRRPFDWEAAGQQLGKTLDGFSAVAVIGSDRVATGKVAVGLARAQAARRRVTLGDLLGESSAIEGLVNCDDPHGLVDNFLYGVSLTRIAHPVPDAGQLHVMFSGTEPPPYEEMLPSPRWARLASGFREVGALFVVAAPVGAPNIEKLVAALDGAVLVGDVKPRDLPASQVISAIREPRRTEAVERPATVRASARAAPTPAAPAPAPAPAPASQWTGRRIAAAGGIVLTLILAAAGAWLAYRPLAERDVRANQAPKPDTARGLHKVLAAQPVPSGTPNTTSSSAAVPHVTNPGDSAQAAAFAVELMAANTQAGAILKLQRDGKNLPAATFAPVQIQGARWFKVIAGAFTDRAGADSLLATLRRRKLLDSLSGAVVRVPFAFLIDIVPPAAVPGTIATYADQGQPVYALRQSDGKVWLLAGAFESASQSSMYAESLRASNITPMLVFRKGRSF